MNEINLNMTPNPLDLQTLHCSQGDTGARKFKIKLHNNGEVIDTSNVKEQVEFPVYKGGTEELLPTNTSTPVTSPIDADIQYPQGLLTDQVFTYRESPTEEDGKAKIKSIRGNTLKWNQLVQNGNFADTSVWRGFDASFTVSNNIATIVSTNAFGRIRQDIAFTNEHKYLIIADIKKSNANDDIRLYYGLKLGGGSYSFANNTNWQTLAEVKTCNETGTDKYPNVQSVGGASTWQQRNMMVIDLTAMGLDITDPSEFTNLFPLSYYQYDTGTLLPFKGEGIKTVGFNLYDKTTIASKTWFNDANGTITHPDGYNLTDYIKLIPNAEYYRGVTGSIRALFFDENKNVIAGNWAGTTTVFTAPSYAHYIRFTLTDDNVDTFCINISDSSKNGTYEPYTSSTTNLPVSTYFQQGMNRVNDVYDELTPSKAVKRIGKVDLGTLTWTYDSTNQFFNSNNFGVKNPTTYAERQTGVVCAIYKVSSTYAYNQNMDDKSILRGTNNNVVIKDTSYSDATTFKTAMNGVYLVYELSEYEETPITTASLVTENGEIALKSEGDYLVGECNSDISENAGFIDAKVKLSDADGDIYSNKIQIHVERSPQ